jgi:hypothetical protein
VAELIRQQQLDADVGYHSFCFQESDDGDLPVPYPDDSVFGQFLNTFPGRIDIFSAGHTHTASVAVEVWNGPPPEEDWARWDEHGEVDFESASGEVALWSMSLGRTDAVITLSDRGGAWRVQVCCAGREEAERLSEQTGTAEGAERYLVRFWPKA